MAKANRTCKVCGEKYYYCPSCPDEMRPSWYGMFHDENCKNIFYILMNTFLKKNTKATARKQLEKCNLSNISSFNSDIQEQINEILSTKKKRQETVLESEIESESDEQVDKI